MLGTWNAVATLDRMLDDVMGSALGTAMSSRTFAPAIDVRANDNEVTLVMDVPGVKQEDLEITLAGGVLTIKASRHFDGSAKDQVLLGRAYGSFTRSYTLPPSLDPQDLRAELEGGVLTIRIAKRPEARPRRIEVKAGGSPKQLTE